MRGSCSTAFRSIPSRVSSVRPSLLSPALRASAPSPSPFASSSRSFSSTLPTAYRHAHWVTSRQQLKEVASQTEKDSSKTGFVKGLKGMIFEPSSPSGSSSPKATTESGDKLDELEQEVGAASEQETARRREELATRKKREEEAKLRQEEKLSGGRRESQVDEWKKPQKEDKEKAMLQAIKNRKIPIEYKFKTATFKVSPRKLAIIGRQLTRRPIDEAILQMQFSDKRSAHRLANAMIQGRNHAVDLGMEKDKLFLQAVWVGKGATLARRNIMGRGRTGIMHHRSARMYFNLVRGQTYMEKEHARHLQMLKSIRTMGPSIHARLHRQKARVEFMGKGSWRW